MRVSPMAPWSPYAAPFDLGTPPPHVVLSPVLVSSAPSLVSYDGVPLRADDAPSNHFAYLNCEHQGSSSLYADDTAEHQFARAPSDVMPASYGMALLYDKAPPSAGFFSAASFPSSLPSPVRLQHDNPRSFKKADARKGYFPISWRVVGGGVLMGGTKGKVT